MTKMIKRISLQHEIISFIKNLIQEKQLKAGDRLPSQSEMLEMMGVSRTALREAIKTLEAKDIIEVKNGKGVYVKENFRDALANQVKFAKEKDLLVELLEARCAIEREMLKLIVQHASSEELEDLGNTVSVLMDKYHHGERQNKEDKEFHQKTYKMCHHEVFEQLLEFLSDRLNQLWEFPLNMKNPFTETIPLHEDLYHAMCERNAQRAIDINKKILNMMIKEIREQN